MRIAYKLLRVRKDGTLGSLFIHCRARIPVGKWLRAENHPTQGYAVRPGWHCTHQPVAPHLSTRGRCWYRVQIQDYQPVVRPQQQGGIWYLAQRMKLLGAA